MSQNHNCPYECYFHQYNATHLRLCRHDDSPKHFRQVFTDEVEDAWHDELVGER